MQKIEEIINIANKVFVKNIKKQIKKIKDSQFRDEVKNNLSMAGELLIDSIYMFNKKKTIAAISILRNVYEMTLKGIVLDKNEEIFNSYQIIKKSGKADKDNSSKIRKFIGENFKEYFYVLENDESFNNIYGNGVLTYLYDKLCSYSHSSKIMEELYKIKKDEIIVNQMICIFLLYVMVVFFMDATSVKLNRTNISEATFIFYTIIVAYSFYDWTLNKDELNKLQKYNEIIDLSIDLNQDYYQKEKELTSYITGEIQKEIKQDISIEENVEFEKYLKKYCGKTNYQDLVDLFPKIKF